MFWLFFCLRNVAALKIDNDNDGKITEEEFRQAIERLDDNGQAPELNWGSLVPLSILLTGNVDGLVENNNQQIDKDELWIILWKLLLKVAFMEFELSMWKHKEINCCAFICIRKTIGQNSPSKGIQ